MQLPAVNLVVVQPFGYVHSLGFLDQARYFRHQFRRLGAQVTISKNRLREDAVNFVFGAHLGCPAEWRERHACVFVNLEQLGDGGAAVSPDYLALLRGGAVVDYDASNVSAYADDPADVPIVPFLHAPYLDDGAAAPIEERPIDLLFFGSMNPRRQAFVRRVEACGVQVSFLDQPLYGPERDLFVRRAKAVLNCHFYETSRFEQARAFQCLSLGTPVISERTPHTRAPAGFADAVFWLDDSTLERFFRDIFRSPRFGDAARLRLDAFRRHDPIEAYADALAFAAGYRQARLEIRAASPWRPERLNLGSGKDYRPGWLNVDVVERTQPDLLLDLGRPLELPARLPGCRGGEVLLEAGSLERVHANNVLEHVPDLPALMTNLLALLREGGEVEIEVPYEKALTAWQDPTHVRAMNENSWLYYTDWFWYLGWFEHRFEMASSRFLDLQHAPVEAERAAFMQVLLRKVPTTVGERTLARTLQADFGGLDDDLPPAAAEPSAVDADDAVEPSAVDACDAAAPCDAVEPSAVVAGDAAAPCDAAEPSVVDACEAAGASVVDACDAPGAWAVDAGDAVEPSAVDAADAVEPSAELASDRWSEPATSHVAEAATDDAARDAARDDAADPAHDAAPAFTYGVAYGVPYAVTYGALYGAASRSAPGAAPGSGREDATEAPASRPTPVATAAPGGIVPAFASAGPAAPVRPAAPLPAALSALAAPVAPTVPSPSTARAISEAMSRVLVTFAQ